MSGKTIKVFLVDGNPSGVKTIELSNWTGKAISGPRQDLPLVIQREEFDKPAVYFLFGPDSEYYGEITGYVGEAENLKVRLQQQAKLKEFWTEFVAFISKDENLTKAHIKYLEAKIIETAKSINRINILNSSIPTPPSLPESDRNDMDVYFSNLKIIIRLLGFNLLDRVKETRIRIQKSQKFYYNRKDLYAEAIKTDEGLAVLKNSTSSLDETKALQPTYKQLRAKLIKLKKLIRKDNLYIFNEDVVFSSPSAALSVITGAPISGPKHWKNINGKSYSDLEEEELMPIK